MPGFAPPFCWAGAAICGLLLSCASTLSAQESLRDRVDTAAPAADNALASDASVVRIVGLSRTSSDTILGLLPREPPARYSDAEVQEFSRRLANLEIFDSTDVQRRNGGIEVSVREKWTLIPMLDLATGSSWKDTYLSVAMSEHNFLGRAMLLRGELWHEARGWNGELALQEHAYQTGRGSFGGAVGYESSEFEFLRDVDSWAQSGGGASVSWRAATPHTSQSTYQLGLNYYLERNTTLTGEYKPPNGHQLQAEVVWSWENFRWSDLVSDGVRFTLTAGPGVFLGAARPQVRSAAETTLIGALAMTRTTVMMVQARGVIVTRGNANFSRLVDSATDVRGIEDGVYHSWAQAVLNLELRQALRIHARWAVQAVAFADAALFALVNAQGRHDRNGSALGMGVGLRVIPTFLADVVLRADFGYTFQPSAGPFFQWALSQYF